MKVVQERNIVNVADSSFDAGFAKYYQFKLHYSKTVSNKRYHSKMFDMCFIFRHVLSKYSLGN